MILAINSSTLQYGIAVLSEDGAVITEHLSSLDEKGFTGFMPAMDSMLIRSSVSFDDINSVAVAIGPGSFTGLRVGLSAAKGFACGLDIPVIGVSGTEALASQAETGDLKICSMITSRKGEVFSAFFTKDTGDQLTRLQDDMSFTLQHLADSIDGPHLLIGNDYGTQAGIFMNMPGNMVVPAPENEWVLKASSVGKLGLKRFHEGDFDNIRDIVPSYLRPPDVRPSSI